MSGAIINVNLARIGLNVRQTQDDIGTDSVQVATSKPRAGIADEESSKKAS